MDLFSTDKTEFHLPQAELIYMPHFYNPQKTSNLFDVLKETIEWQQDSITVFGKTHPQPRLTALYADNKNSYTYSNITMQPKLFTPELQNINTDIENVAKTDFTSILLNRYRSGTDSNGWHADNEKALGKRPIIASLSLGTPRYFHFKHRTIKTEKYKLLLESGSLLIMAGAMQQYWLHQIPKTKREVGERINLTFRKII